MFDRSRLSATGKNDSRGCPDGRMLDREVTRPVDGPLLPAGSGTADLPGGTYARDAAVINQSARRARPAGAVCELAPEFGDQLV